MGTLTKNSKNITLSKETYLKLLETYQKLGEILICPKKKKLVAVPSLKTLYGIWERVKVDKKDFKEAEKPLFKTSLS